MSERVRRVECAVQGLLVVVVVVEVSEWLRR